jgi:hypothetical protein
VKNSRGQFIAHYYNDGENLRKTEKLFSFFLFFSQKAAFFQKPLFSFLFFLRDQPQKKKMEKGKNDEFEFILTHA